MSKKSKGSGNGYVVPALTRLTKEQDARLTKHVWRRLKQSGFIREAILEKLDRLEYGETA